MDARRSPSWILGHHAKDQFPNFLRSLSSPYRPAHFGNQLPIQPEASPMPLDHRFRVDHDKRLFPPGPEPPRHDSEQLIEYRKPWPCVPPFQCRELLAKSKVFKKQHASGEKHAKDRAKQESEGVCHATLLRHFACEMQCCILLKSKADRILANDSGKQRGGSMPLVIMRHRMGTALFHGQTGLGTVKSLDLALLVQ